MPLRRLALLSSSCALAVCALLFASGALGASSRRHVDSYHSRHTASHGRHHLTCGRRHAGGRSHRHHAKHSSLRSSSRGSGSGARCRSRRHRARAHRHTAAGHRHTAGSSGCAGADLTPTAGNLASVRAATLCLINHERSSHGEGPLAVNDRIQQAAEAHSEEMASADYFDHIGPHGDTPSARLRASGYIYSSHVGYEVGENIGWGSLWLATPRAIVSAWMSSPGHRENILNASFHDTGVGVSASLPASMGGGQQGAMYTQDFGVIF